MNEKAYTTVTDDAKLSPIQMAFFLNQDYPEEFNDVDFDLLVEDVEDAAGSTGLVMCLYNEEPFAEYIREYLI